MTDIKKSRPAADMLESVGTGRSRCMTMDNTEKEKARPSLLLHSCCGPCSTAVVERLVPDYDITIYFFNPNITEEEEYKRRMDSQRIFIAAYNNDPGIPYRIGFKEGPYDSRTFYEAAAGFSNEPEGGRRCQQCFLLRMEKTAETAKIMGFDFFATTLTVSPHKDYDAISHIGRRLASVYGVSFLDEDFKKKGGFQRSVELSKKYKLYRQNYCGCEYSK